MPGHGKDEEADMHRLTALSALDGRYEKAVQPLKEIFSEYGLVKHRVIVETKWLEYLSSALGLFDVSRDGLKRIKGIADRFTVDDSVRIKDIEGTTNHDVKAVEYYIKDELEEAGLGEIKEWTHFSCTSEDINNAAYALMLKSGREVILNTLEAVVQRIEELAQMHKSLPMMSRTHGQPASPTTVGKEFVNFAWRLRREMRVLGQADIEAKFNGATGNYNAHSFVYSERDWISIGETFVRNYLQVTPLLFSAQINPGNYIAEILHGMIRLSSTLIDLDRDMWGYISLGYFKQQLKEGEVGSSTMPHKVNPIDFENSEGNLGVAISMMEHLAVKLLNSRFQRDLSDSTVLRNLGAVFGYFIIGLTSSLKGLSKIEPDAESMQSDLDDNLELLAEPIQTAMRVYGETDPYEKLKALTRGKKITKRELSGFIDSLESVPEDVKTRMRSLTPAGYTGMAEALVDRYFEAS